MPATVESYRCGAKTRGGSSVFAVKLQVFAYLTDISTAGERLFLSFSTADMRRFCRARASARRLYPSDSPRW
jgi:hypothetical protein